MKDKKEEEVVPFPQISTEEESPPLKSINEGGTVFTDSKGIIYTLETHFGIISKKPTSYIKKHNVVVIN